MLKWYIKHEKSSTTAASLHFINGVNIIPIHSHTWRSCIVIFSCTYSFRLFPSLSFIVFSFVYFLRFSLSFFCSFVSLPPRSLFHVPALLEVCKLLLWFFTFFCLLLLQRFIIVSLILYTVCVHFFLSVLFQRVCCVFLRIDFCVGASAR